MLCKSTYALGGPLEKSGSDVASAPNSAEGSPLSRNPDAESTPSSGSCDRDVRSITLNALSFCPVSPLFKPFLLTFLQKPFNALVLNLS